MTPPKTLCLNMIVRNEMANLPRCLGAVADHIGCWVIGDTGSSDGTQAFIRGFFAERGVPGELHEFPFVNFEQARNAALERAYASELAYDYLLFDDADMELVVEDPDFRSRLEGPGYQLVQRSVGDLVYWNTRLARRNVGARYHGVTHEYLDVPGGTQRLQGVWYRDHASGANRVDKFERDARLLTEALKQDPDNHRHWFYLAQSYRDAGRTQEAADAYAKRAGMGGWDEEAWNARLQEARCLRTLGDEGGFLRAALAAFNQRPQRAEPLYDLARYYRDRGMHDASVLFSEPGLALKRPEQDILFLEDFVYTAGLREEFSIAANYSRDPARKDRGHDACDWLALSREVPQKSRDLARSNLFFYTGPAKALMPSFSARQVGFTPPDGWKASNPSIARLGQQIVMLQRCVNFTQAEDGEYKTSDGSPIATRNFLLRLNPDLGVESSTEILPPAGLPAPAFDLVLGFEDARLFAWRGELWCVSTVRQLTPDGWPEQVLARIDCSPDGPCRLVDWRVLRPEGPRLHEKSWMPLVAGDDLRFICSCGPTRVVDALARPVSDAVPSIAAEQFRGGSQAIEFDGGRLALVHEVSERDRQRFYWHRFVWFDADNVLRRVSRRFYFKAKGIEFAAGMVWHPDGRRLLISYGVGDSEAWIATVDGGEVRCVLEDAKRLRFGTPGTGSRGEHSRGIEIDMTAAWPGPPANVGALVTPPRAARQKGGAEHPNDKAIAAYGEAAPRQAPVDIQGVQSKSGEPGWPSEAGLSQEVAMSKPGLSRAGSAGLTALPYTALPYAVRRAADFCPDISVENITRRIGYASYVNVERRYMYYQVSKAGCTSMKWLLHSLERLPPIEYFIGPQRKSRRDMFIHERSSLKIPSLLDLDNATQEFVLTSPEFMRFTVVRNPYTRTEAAWKDKVRLCAPTYEQFYRAIKGKLPTGNGSSSLVSFGEFVDAISREDLANCDAHWRLQAVQTLRGALNFSHIGRLEDFADIIRTLHAHLGEAEPQRTTSMNRTAGTSHYDEDTARAVYELYQQDFETFGYDRDSWVRPSNEAKPSVVPEAIFVDEVLERNIVIGHLYEERDALKRRVQELEKSLRDKEQSRRIENGMTAARSGPLAAGPTLVALLEAAWQKGELVHPSAEIIAESVRAAGPRAAGPKALYEAARFCRDKGLHDASVLLCEAGFALVPPDDDTLFREDFVYTAGLQEEFSIAANYSRDLARKDRGFAACNWLALSREVTQSSRGLARWNLFFYIKAASAVLPSFTARPVKFAPPEGYRAMNPSVARQGECLVLAQRCVHCPVTDDGKYETPDGGLAHTRNYLLRLSNDLDIQSAVEILPPADMPVSYAGRIQDQRLFAWHNALWCCAGVRELTQQGQCEQMLARIDVSTTGACRLADWRVLRFDGAKQIEKNWMPRVSKDELRFIYLCDPTRMLDDEARTIAETTSPIAADAFRGGTPAIEFDGGWLALIHEVSVRNQKGHYWHRFVWFNSEAALRRVSRPFYFHKKGIEFAAGLAWHPDGMRLLISYGVNDCEVLDRDG